MLQRHLPLVPPARLLMPQRPPPDETVQSIFLWKPTPGPRAGVEQAAGGLPRAGGFIPDCYALLVQLLILVPLPLGIQALDVARLGQSLDQLIGRISAGRNLLHSRFPSCKSCGKTHGTAVHRQHRGSIGMSAPYSPQP